MKPPFSWCASRQLNGGAASSSRKKLVYKKQSVNEAMLEKKKNLFIYVLCCVSKFNPRVKCSFF